MLTKLDLLQYALSGARTHMVQVTLNTHTDAEFKEVDDHIREIKWRTLREEKKRLYEDLVKRFPLLKAANAPERKHRLCWLAEGMLANHLAPPYRGWPPKQEEIDAYQAYRAEVVKLEDQA